MTILTAKPDKDQPFVKNSSADAKSEKAKGFPAKRMRRLRQNGWIRDLVKENTLTPKDLIQPFFVVDGIGIREAIPSMSGINRMSVDVLINELSTLQALDLSCIALFPVIAANKKTADGREATNKNNLICNSLRRIKDKFPDLGIITDVALDPFTTHGHDGLLEDGKILNDATIEILTEQALVQTEAGADIIAPSDMMDGRIAAIRNALENNGHADTIILSYAAKYASAFYGPFRDAVQSSGLLQGDKKTYQMNPANSDEALREVALDIEEGADMVMIKPGLPYLDIIRRVKDSFAVPTFAYHVSGEYAMLKAAAQNGWLDHDKAMMETLISFKRAGADGILTYCAIDAAKLLQKA